MGVSAVAGAVVGGIMQGRAAKKAARANKAQQAAAMAFQKEQTQASLKEASKAFRFGREATLAESEAAKRDVEASLEARGMDAAGTIGLGAKRAVSADAAKNISQLYANIGQMRAGLYQGQSFPMIMEQGPQGNWAADAARLGMMMGNTGLTKGQVAVGGMGQQIAGQALSNAGFGMFGSAMQMAGGAMTDAAMEE